MMFLRTVDCILGHIRVALNNNNNNNDDDDDDDDDDCEKKKDLF